MLTCFLLLEFKIIRNNFVNMFAILMYDHIGECNHRRLTRRFAASPIGSIIGDVVALVSVES